MPCCFFHIIQKKMLGVIIVDINETIFTRRSIRKFVETHISDEMVKNILKAGFHAPTAGNKRPVHFILVKDKALLETLSQAKQEAEMLRHAELAIVVCGVPEILSDCFKIYRENLSLPENIIPVGTIAIGGIGEEKSSIDRYEDEKVHYNHW